jgi:G protein beta subunit-like protein
MSAVLLATGGYDHGVRFWEATSGVCYRTLQYPDSQVNKLEITADKTQIAAAGNPQIRVFDVAVNDPQPVNTFDGHSGNVTAVGYQKDSKWMFSGETWSSLQCRQALTKRTGTYVHCVRAT